MPQFGEAIAVLISKAGEDEKFATIWCGVEEVNFDSGINVYHNTDKTEIKAPHWKHKTDNKEKKGGGSKKAAVYLVKGAKGGKWEGKVNVQINKLENLKGKAKLSGNIGGLTFNGKKDFDLEEKSIPVDIEIKADSIPEGITRYAGNISWKLDLPQGIGFKSINSTHVELFFILAEPIAAFKKGVWVEALRFACNDVNLKNNKDKKDIAVKVAIHCFKNMVLLYDTWTGGPHFGTNSEGGTFKLSDYIKVRTVKARANCTDQAGAVQVICGAVGVEIKWLKMKPFGYLAKTSLLGWPGDCNNPGFNAKGSAQDIGDLDPKRIPFGFHAFNEYSGKVIDACAGPHLATETKKEYILAAIDQNPKLPQNVKGDESKINDFAGIKSIV